MKVTDIAQSGKFSTGAGRACSLFFSLLNRVYTYRSDKVVMTFSCWRK